ncbi:hypothetical protein BJV78DRAFT_1156728 [Lactifluus subvellereus]|nr:hypothetical protein BJV78DRAFT_1156728 [Lactifluus subvellereus]
MPPDGHLGEIGPEVRPYFLAIIADSHRHRVTITKMVNWNDPSVVFNDYLALTKLDHVIAGIYIWEIVFTAGFELDVLRGKRPYRWSIWHLAAAICDYKCCIRMRQLGICLSYHRSPIAIWNRQRIISFLSVGAWLAGVATAVHSLTMVRQCCELNWYMVSPLPTGDALPSLFHWLLMLFKCIIGIALACIAGVPYVVFLVLNLNATDTAVIPDVHSHCGSLGSARLYRSLCQHGSLTEYMTSELPHSSPGRPISNAQYRAGNVHSSIHFVAATESNSTGSTSEAPGFIPKDPVQLRFAPGASNLRHEDMEDKVG